MRCCVTGHVERRVVNQLESWRAFGHGRPDREIILNLQAAQECKLRVLNPDLELKKVVEELDFANESSPLSVPE